MNEEGLFIDNARFAKVVETPNGPGLLIGGHVFEVKSPFPDGISWLASALRRTDLCESSVGGSRIASSGIGLGRFASGAIAGADTQERQADQECARIPHCGTIGKAG